MQAYNNSLNYKELKVQLNTDNFIIRINEKLKFFRIFNDLFGICLNSIINHQCNSIDTILLHFILSILRYNGYNPNKIIYNIVENQILFGEVVYCKNIDNLCLELDISRKMLHQFLVLSHEAPKIDAAKDLKIAIPLNDNVVIDPLVDTNRNVIIRLFVIADHFVTHCLEKLALNEIDFVNHSNFGLCKFKTIHSLLVLTSLTNYDADTIPQLSLFNTMDNLKLNTLRLA